MSADDVLSVMTLLRAAEVDVWIGGGWGIDALLGREIDLHPLAFASDGSAVQASFERDRPFAYPARCFVTGRIGGSAVGCLSAEQQVYFHQGYEPGDRDRHDMAQLRAAFGLDTHF
jgi:lincosamide nucleotidyltransferase A/C/D/E